MNEETFAIIWALVGVVLIIGVLIIAHYWVIPAERMNDDEIDREISIIGKEDLTDDDIRDRIYELIDELEYRQKENRMPYEYYHEIKSLKKLLE